jgi:hypothetical protein
MRHQNPVAIGDFDDTGQILQGALCIIAARLNFQNQAQVKVEIKRTEVKSEMKPSKEWLAKRPPVPPEGCPAPPDVKRRRCDGAAPSSGAFCRRSRPAGVPLPPAVAAAGGGPTSWPWRWVVTTSQTTSRRFRLTLVQRARTLATPSGRSSSPSWRPTRQRTATAAYRRALKRGPRGGCARAAASSAQLSYDARLIFHI